MADQAVRQSGYLICIRISAQASRINHDISEATGIPVSTVNKIFSGATKSPRYDTLLAIEDAIGKMEKHSKEITRYEYGKSIDNPMMVQESSSYAFDTRRYTEEDLENLPEGSFAELIDGVLYFKGMPSLTHEAEEGTGFEYFYSGYYGGLQS